MYKRQQYDNIKIRINKMMKHKEDYKFNIRGLFSVAINKKVIKPNTFYCAEFVQYLLENANIDTKYLPYIIKPEDFKKLKNVKLIYKGRLREYRDRIKELEAPKSQIKQPIAIPRRAAV